MCTTTTNDNFSKINTVTGNYKSIGYAYSYPCSNDVFEGMDFEAEIHTDIEISSDVESQLIDMAHNGTHCNDCGSAMRICVIIQDTDNETIHVVGRDCGESIDMFGTTTRRLNDKSARAMKTAKGKRDMNKILKANEGLAEALTSSHNIVQSINEGFLKYKKMSEKQIALVFKLSAQTAKFDAINASAKEITFKKCADLELTVTSRKTAEGMYGVQEKVVLKSADGWALYGTLGVRSDDVKVGDTVKLTSNKITLPYKKKSTDRDIFGFFSRGKIELVKSA